MIRDPHIPRSPQSLDMAALARHLELSLGKPLGPQARLAQNRAGELLVIKTGPGASAYLIGMLKKFQALFPPFQYPGQVAAQADFYLVYPFIPGQLLSEGDYESEACLAAVFELSGRLTALFRSLRLAPMFQGWQNHGAGGSHSQGGAVQRLAALHSSQDCQVDGLALRRQEASQSYAWAQEVICRGKNQWPAGDAAPALPWAALAERVETVTSIHLPPTGSNLAHTGFTPEHLLLTPAGQWGVVGWRLAPRPYNYMRYCYLAWCLVHTKEAGMAARYRHFLEKLPSMDASPAHLLTFALCLIDAWVKAGPDLDRRAEKLRTIVQFIDAALLATEATTI